MNKIVYLVVVVMLFSCKSSTIAQEKVPEKSQKPKVEKPKFSDVQDQQRIEPNTILLTASIGSISKDAVICGKSYKSITAVKVNQILGSGSGLVNLLSAGQDVELAFMNTKANDYDTLKEKFVKGQKMTLKVREGLCPDMTQTVYEIVTFKAVN